jgi:hypothetical protein
MARGTQSVRAVRPIWPVTTASTHACPKLMPPESGNARSLYHPPRSSSRSFSFGPITRITSFGPKT